MGCPTGHVPFYRYFLMSIRNSYTSGNLDALGFVLGSTAVVVVPKLPGADRFDQMTRPIPLQRKVFDLLGMKLKRTQ